MDKMKTYTLEECLDEHFGEIGTPRRDEFEQKVEEAVFAYNLGEAIKAARKQQELTQEQLGERIGVKKAQISKLENGNMLSLPTLRKVFKALGVNSASLDLSGLGRVVLW